MSNLLFDIEQGLGVCAGAVLFIDQILKPSPRTQGGKEGEKSFFDR